LHISIGALKEYQHDRLHLINSPPNPKVFQDSKQFQEMYVVRDYRFSQRR